LCGSCSAFRFLILPSGISVIFVLSNSSATFFIYSCIGDLFSGSILCFHGNHIDSHHSSIPFKYAINLLKLSPSFIVEQHLPKDELSSNACHQRYHAVLSHRVAHIHTAPLFVATHAVIHNTAHVIANVFCQKSELLPDNTSFAPSLEKENEISHPVDVSAKAAFPDQHHLKLYFKQFTMFAACTSSTLVLNFTDSSQTIHFSFSLIPVDSPYDNIVCCSSSYSIQLSKFCLYIFSSMFQLFTSHAARSTASLIVNGFSHSTFQSKKSLIFHLRVFNQ
jgi:hypothetical protein